MLNADNNLFIKWEALIKRVAVRYDESSHQTPLNECVPVTVDQQDLLAVLINTAFRDTKLWEKHVRATRHTQLPIVEFRLNGKKLPYSAFIDDQGIVALIQLYDNNQSFKVLAESEWDIRKKPILAAAEIAVVLTATIETHLYLSKIAQALEQKGWVSDED